MPIQSIPRSGGAAGLGSLIGGGIGDVISEGLQGLAHAKMQDIQRKRDADEIMGAFPELPHEAVNFLASQPAKERMEFLQQYSSGLQNLQQNQQQEQMGQQQGLQALQQQQQEMQQRPQIPYAPGFQGQRQPEYGGREQQQIREKVQQAQQQLTQSKPQQKPSFAQSLAKGSQEGAGGTKGLTASQNLKLEQDTQKKVEAKKHVQKAYDRTQEILDSGYTGYSLTGLTPEGRKLRNELDTLSEVYISNLIPLLNPKGTMSKERFNYIKNLAPNSWDTDAAIKGKMSALKEIFDLKGSSPERSSKGTIEMRDASGAIYDIPEDQVEKAKKAGLR